MADLMRAMFPTIRNKPFLTLGFALQCFTLIMFFIGIARLEQLIVMNVLSGFLITQHFDQQKNSDFSWSMMSFIFLFCTVFPVIGCVIFCTINVRHKEEERKEGITVNKKIHHYRPSINTSPLTPQQSKQLMSGCSRVHTNLLNVLKRTEGPATHRRQAVLSTRGLNNHLAIPILKNAMSDPDDDVRLVAFALFENREKSILEAIQKLEIQIEDQLNPPRKALTSKPSKDSHSKAHLYHHVARLYWSVEDEGFYEGSLSQHYLRTAYQYSQLAIKEGIKNNDLSRLVADIELKLSGSVSIDMDTTAMKTAISTAAIHHSS